jgi:CBS domain-containing protein
VSWNEVMFDFRSTATPNDVGPWGTDMQVREIMNTLPAYAFPNDSATKVADLMRKHDTGIVAVVEPGSGGELRGLITDYDICTRIIAAGYDPNAVRAGDFMTRDPVRCSPRDPVGYAMLRMLETGVRNIPVVDQGNHLEGMLTSSSLAGNVATAEDLTRFLRSVCASGVSDSANPGSFFGTADSRSVHDA